jgi:hypothetical protein
MIVAKGWHILVAPQVEFAHVLWPPSCHWDVKQAYHLHVPLPLARRGPCPRGYDKTEVMITWRIDAHVGQADYYQIYL